MMRTFFVTHELKLHVKHQVRATDTEQAAQFARSKALRKAADIERRSAACTVNAVEVVEVTDPLAAYYTLI